MTRSQLSKLQHSKKMIMNNEGKTAYFKYYPEMYLQKLKKTVQLLSH
jgi:hypothetical protein